MTPKLTSDALQIDQRRKSTLTIRDAIAQPDMYSITAVTAAFFICRDRTSPTI